MKPSVRACLVPALFLAALPAAYGQATRTWVSGVGDDANPCSRTAPCKTFAGAISKTTAGGEIDALDPAGFGTITITKAITLDGGAGQVGSILGISTTGVTINAGAADAVVLRNLSITAQGTGINGVNLVQAGAVHLENVLVAGFQTGLNLQDSNSPALVTLERVIVRDNLNYGVQAVGGTGTGLQLEINNSTFQATQQGPGLSAGAYTKSLIKNSVASGNTGAGFSLTANGGASTMSLVNCAASSNGAGGFVSTGTGASASMTLTDSAATANVTGGVLASGSSGAGVVRLTRATLVDNVPAVAISAGGAVLSFGDNVVLGGITGGTLVSSNKQ